MFGDAPSEPQIRQQWLRHLGAAAPTRDHYQVTDDTAEQPLGPYVEPGRAGEAAYWHAAHAVIAGHHFAVSGRAEPTTDRLAA